jgi:hypothetical protein
MPRSEEKNKKTATPEYPINTLGVLAPIVGWIIPGGGHFIQKRWVRGLLLLVSVLAMFLVGLAMQGKIYEPNTGDILEMLAFVGDVCTGAIYFIARALGWGSGAIAMASADYGTKFIVVAGLLNLISAIDSHQIAIGKKS